MRIKRLQEFINEHELDAALITRRENLFYFTGSAPVLGGYLVVTPDDALFIVPELEYEEAKANSKVPVEKFKTGKELYERLSSFRPRKLGIEGKTSFSTVQTLKEKAGAKDFVPIDEVIRDLRIIKEAGGEIEAIKAACGIADMAMMAALEEASEGKREREVAARMEYVMKMNGAEKPAFDTIVASGPRSALPHGVASDRRIERGDLVVIDEGALYRHYNSDMTRTIVVGSPNEKQKDIYYAVLEAQRKGVEVARPGMTAKELDTVVRDVIAEYGYGGDYFIHSTGHGVGLEIHEWPRVSQTDDTELRPGMVITVEPGIYIPGFGGVRIEDTILITEGGAVRLTRTERELI